MTQPAGLLGQMASCQQRIELLPGDRLLICSDGLPEAANERGDEFGDEGVVRSLHSLSDRPPDEVCTGLLDEVANHSRGQRQSDDRTVVVLWVRAPGQ